MSKSKLHASPRHFGSTLMVLGAMTMAAGTQTELGADLTHQGAVLGTTVASEPMWIQGQVVLPAATEPNGFGIMAVGMLLMLIGLGIHAVWILRTKNNDRRVPVRQAHKKSNRTSRKQMEVIWVERTIRF